MAIQQTRNTRGTMNATFLVNIIHVVTRDRNLKKSSHDSCKIIQETKCDIYYTR